MKMEGFPAMHVCRGLKIQGRIENPMVIDFLWEKFEKEPEYTETTDKLNRPGWEEIGTGTFVPEEAAYRYAMERISQDDDLKRELKEMVVEWSYSGNWVKKE